MPFQIFTARASRHSPLLWPAARSPAGGATLAGGSPPAAFDSVAARASVVLLIDQSALQAFVERFLGPKKQNLILTFVQLHTKFGTIDENRTKLCSLLKLIRTKFSIRLDKIIWLRSWPDFDQKN